MSESRKPQFLKRRVGRPKIAVMAVMALLTGPVLGGSDAVFERQADDGTIELTNLPDDGGGYEALNLPPPAAQATLSSAPGTAPQAPAPAVPSDHSVSSTANRVDLPPPSSSPVDRPRPGVSTGAMHANLKALYEAARTARRQ